MKRIVFMAFAVFAVFAGIGNCVHSADYELSRVLSETSEYILEAVERPTVASTGGEWAVIGLARGEVDVPQGYFDAYYEELEAVLRSRDGVLHERKYTEYSRVILALTAIGRDPRDVAGYDLLAPLGEFEKTVWQGVNGAAFALIALDCADYDEVHGVKRSDYVDHILDSQLAGGGWSLAGDAVDIDVTAMVLQALSNYTRDKAVREAVDRALSRVSALQTENGGFMLGGTECSESAAQMIVALCELGIPLEDERFVKNGKTLLDNLMSFKKGGGFRHSAGSSDINQMSTEQAFYSIIALRRVLDGKSTLYDMSDIAKREGTADSRNNEDSQVSVLYPGKTFSDIVGCGGRKEIEALAERGIVNGRSDTVFDPVGNVSRAELAAMLVRGLGLCEIEKDIFCDVPRGDPFYRYIGTAYHFGIIKGVSETSFAPLGTVTRQEAAVMLARAAASCGMSTEMNTFAARSVLSCYSDYVKTESWAFCELAFCVSAGIIVEDGTEISPMSKVTREELCVMLYNMLAASGRIK